jgi:hypothetical protein
MHTTPDSDDSTTVETTVAQALTGTQSAVPEHNSPDDVEQERNAGRWDTFARSHDPDRADRIFL